MENLRETIINLIGETGYSILLFILCIAILYYLFYKFKIALGPYFKDKSQFQFKSFFKLLVVSLVGFIFILILLMLLG